MDPQTSNAILLVFTLGPEADSRRRPVLPRRLRTLERDLRSRCLDDILAAGRDTGLELAVATDATLELPADVRRFEQHGSGFGSRLESVVAEVEASRPGQPMVLVGADLPGFSRTHLEGALDRLAADPEAVVVGPSPDGGVYLVAAEGDLAPLLGRVDWCRKHTCSHLVELLASAGRDVVLLPPLADLDRPRDLAGLLSQARSTVLDLRLARTIRAALRLICRAPQPAPTPLPRLALMRSNPHRGPPA